MEKILEVNNLKKFFPLKTSIFSREKKYVQAVNDVSFELYKGETLGLVGESGSGKSTTGRSILKLIEPTDGQIIYKNKDITNLKGEKLRNTRKELQMIFQDPYASLNPRLTIGEAISEPMLAHNLYNR